MKIGIVGGGIMGLALAYRLSKKGHQVSVFERSKQLGGLATYHDFGGFFWDRFYHVVLPTDSQLIHFFRDLGLGDNLHWKQTYTGFYVDEQFYSMSTSMEFLRFPPVSLWGKFRMALTILYCSRINDWKRLEKIYVEDWLLKLSGKKTYEKIWKPLLLAKLGESYKRVSAVFIWSYIKRMYSAREDSSAQKEQLGYISGGYKRVFEELEKQINASNGNIHTNTQVDKISSSGKGVDIQHDGNAEHFDKVIFTGPVNIMRQVCDPALVEVGNTDADVEYLGVACVVLVTKKPLTPYYVVNIADSEIPFTGLITTSNIAPPEETGGLYLNYLPKYIISDDPFLQKPDEEIEVEFMKGLRKMFPDLDDFGIVSIHINRALKVQPLQVINYSRLVPSAKTRHEDFYVVNTSQFVNNTLNNNEAIKNVNRFLQQYEDDFATS